MAHPPHTHVPQPVLRRELSLAGALATGPLASFASLLVLWYRTGEKCKGASPLALAVVLLLAALATLAALGRSLRVRRQTTRAAHDLPPRTLTRLQFMAQCGLALNAFALLVVLALGVPLLILRPCE